MKVCILTEGSFPYVPGGVSSWVGMIIRSMPDIEFLIYCINSNTKNKGQFKCEIPKNVTLIKEVFLDDYMDENSNGKKIILNTDEKLALSSFIKGEDTDWLCIFNLINKKCHQNVTGLLMCKDFYEIVSEVCSDKYKLIPFNNYFWMIRSMLLPLFVIIKNGVPEADVYHSTATGFTGIALSMGHCLYNKPTILTEHGIYTREREEEIIKSDWVSGEFKDIWIQYFYSLSKCAYEYSDIVMSLFEKAREIQIELGCPEEKTQVIPNGIDCDSFKDIPRKKNHSKISVGAIIRIAPIKDVETMLQAFAKVNERIKNVEFIIMGHGDENPEYFDECKNLADRLEFKNLNFAGRVNIKEYIGKMDILVLTSISEGQPLSVLEGMAAGKPQVLTNVGSCHQLVYGNNDPYGQAGIVVPIMDYNAISSAVVELCENEDLRLQMGKNAFNRATNLYRFDEMINSYRKLYLKLKGE